MNGEDVVIDMPITMLFDICWWLMLWHLFSFCIRFFAGSHDLYLHSFFRICTEVRSWITKNKCTTMSDFCYFMSLRVPLELFFVWQLLGISQCLWCDDRNYHCTHCAVYKMVIYFLYITNYLYVFTEWSKNAQILYIITLQSFVRIILLRLVNVGQQKICENWQLSNGSGHWSLLLRWFVFRKSNVQNCRKMILPSCRTQANDIVKFLKSNVPNFVKPEHWPAHIMLIVRLIWTTWLSSELTRYLDCTCSVESANAAAHVPMSGA